MSYAMHIVQDIVLGVVMLLEVVIMVLVMPATYMLDFFIGNLQKYEEGILLYLFTEEEYKIREADELPKFTSY